MTHKQKLVDALMSDKLVTRKSFKFKVSRRISDLKKDGWLLNQYLTSNEMVKSLYPTNWIIKSLKKH